MPWPEVNVMELRNEFVLRALREDLPFTTLCAEYGISPKTGYKWKERFLRDGAAGLSDRSRRPRRCPVQVPEDLLLELIRLKMLHPAWGPKKLREIMLRIHAPLAVPALSTLKRLLQRAGLVKPQRRRRATAGERLTQALVVSAPNQVWTVDFKGWWYSAERERIEPLTVRDAFSRYVLCAQILCDSRTETVRACFESLFAKYGLPQVIQSDNGVPFASRSAPLGLSRLAAWWVVLGIGLNRSRPGHPSDNGGHERMHRDIAQEVEGVARGSRREQQAALDVWRQEFNQQRPHESLGQRFPAEIYHRSPRRFDPRPVELEYPAGYLRRKVGASGGIKLANRWIRLTTALSGWHVGLQLLESDRFRVWFANLPLGEISLPDESFIPARS